MFPLLTIVLNSVSNHISNPFYFDSLIYGLEGNDNLLGDNGADTLIRGTGNDVLTGDSGNDSLVDGQCRDIFALEDDDTKLDFESTDQLSSLKDITSQANGITFTAGLDLETAKQVLGIAEQVGNDTVINFTRIDEASPLNGIVTLSNFDVNDLTIDNFSLR